MKRLLAAVLTMVAMSAYAQDRPPLTPEQKAKVANGVMAVVVGPVLLPAAILTGNREALCKGMGATYVPDGADQCPNGLWLNLIPYIKDAKNSQ